MTNLFGGRAIYVVFPSFVHLSALALLVLITAPSRSDNALYPLSDPGTRGWCDTPAPQDGTAGVYATNAWPDGMVYYTFDPSITAYEQQRMLDAFADISANTNLEFVVRTTQPNYIYVTRSTTPGASSSSSIGMSGSQQFIRMWDTHWDLHGVLIHEIGHAVGLYHEQQRSDRNQFIEIISSNITPGFAGNFSIVGAATFGPYDFDSVMHYDQYGFSIGPATIRVRQPYQRFWQWRIGQYVLLEPHLSLGDRWVLRHLYGGDLPPQPFSLMSPTLGQTVGDAWIPNFSWQSATAATSYLVEVDDDPLFRSPEISTATLEPNFADRNPLVANRLYFWRVTASNAMGETVNFPLPWQTFFTADAYPATLYVDDSAAPTGDGTSWNAALSDLRLALELVYASNGVVLEIRVGQGVYRPDLISGDRAQSFPIPKGCAVRGGYAGYGAPNPDARDIQSNVTILSGDLAGNDAPNFMGFDENSYRILTGDWSTADSQIDGFFIQGGNAVGPNWEQVYGGGLSASFGAPRISNCTFSENLSVGGSASFVESAALVIGCRFIGNRSWVIGGGLNAFLGSPTIVNCEFQGNIADRGGAVNLTYSSGHLINCTLSGNTAYTAGGALQTYWNSASRLTNCVLWDNDSPLGDEIRIERYPGQSPSSLIVSRSLIAGGELGISIAAGNSLNWGAGNVEADPKFADSSIGDLRLLPGSPCIDAGVNIAVPVDSLDLDDDGNTTERTPLDLGGATRFHDAPNTPDTGSGLPPLIDMGADEYIPADCDNDGDADLSDFAASVGCLTGPNAAFEVAACRCVDFDGDVDVDLQDLRAFQNSFADP